MKALLIDFSRTLVFPKDPNYKGALNLRHLELSGKETNYKFEDHFILNQELLNFLATLKGKLKMYIYTTGTIQDLPEIKTKLDAIFDGIFTVLDTGTDKSDPESYKKLSFQIGEDPSEILFIDDTQDNLNAAVRAGFLVMQYKNNAEVMTKLKSIEIS